MLKCPYCGENAHVGFCPKVESIEYHRDGTIRKVTFKDGTVQGYGSIYNSGGMLDDLYEQNAPTPSGSARVFNRD